MFSSNLFVIGLIAIGVIFIVCFFSYVRVPVNKIAFISGIGKNRVAKGKLVIYLRFFERVDYLDLSVFSVDVNTAVAVPTNDFINIKVDAVVNLQVDETAGILEIAAKNFLNRKSSDIAISVKDVLEGNLREIVGQMQLKEIVQNRKNFNEKVQENVAPDLREMGRVTSAFLKELDRLSPEIVLIATTNLFENLDKAVTRRFDAIIDFDRYTDEDKVEVATIILNELLKQFKNVARDLKLFKKIINSANVIPNPGDLRNAIRTSLAFSDPSDPHDYQKRLLRSLHNGRNLSISKLSKLGFTVREIEILTGVSKSSVSRELSED